MKTTVYVLTHKNFIPPNDTKMYVPLHVGHTFCVSDYGFMGDDTGDNISERNDTFSELTGLYWAWKNDDTSDIIGTCHYRRYLINEGEELLTEPEVEEILKDYDLITTKELKLNFPYEYGFKEHHKPLYLEETKKAIESLYPEDLPVFNSAIKGVHTYFGNMMIMKKETYSAYMKWLFDILFFMDRNITVDEPDSYHRRIYGFISEFLLYVYVKSRGLKAYECKVGMTEEKAEIKEVRHALAEFFKDGDLNGAKEYFLEQREKRPDLLMEASDITGELHIAMQIIATAGLEQRKYGENLLTGGRDFKELVSLFAGLNDLVSERKHGPASEEEHRYIKEKGLSEEALFVAEKMYGKGI